MTEKKKKTKPLPYKKYCVIEVRRGGRSAIEKGLFLKWIKNGIGCPDFVKFINRAGMIESIRKDQTRVIAAPSTASLKAAS